MANKRIVVLGAQVLFVRGGAELFYEALVREINKLEGYEAELVLLPYKGFPEKQLENDIALWESIDIEESQGGKIDLVIATRFPTYAVNHPNKILWLLHQHRFSYDLEGSEYDIHKDPGIGEEERKAFRERDTARIASFPVRFSISENVRDRLEKYNGLTSEVLLPPLPFGEKIVSGHYGDYVLCVGRLGSLKRPGLLLEGLKESSEDLRIIYVGKGSGGEAIKAKAESYGLSHRCDVRGFVPEEEVVELLAGARAVYYGPVDEDYGYATIEAFLARKPVVTLSDSGQVATFVRETGSGIVAEANGWSIGRALDEIAGMDSRGLEEMSRGGYEFAKTIAWENVLPRLLGSIMPSSEDRPSVPPGKSLLGAAS